MAYVTGGATDMVVEDVPLVAPPLYTPRRGRPEHQVDFRPRLEAHRDDGSPWTKESRNTRKIQNRGKAKRARAARKIGR